MSKEVSKMSRKKMLVAEGFFDEKVIEDAIEEVEEVEEVEEDHYASIVEEEDFFCQFCNKFFETEKGVSIHEKRWCKEKQKRQEIYGTLLKPIEDDWQEI